MFGVFPTDLSNWINGRPSSLAIQLGPLPPTAYLAVARGAFLCDRPGQLFNENFDGQIAEVIVYSRKLELAEQRSLESYLSAKYSIPLGSPVPALGWPGATLVATLIGVSGIWLRPRPVVRPMASRGGR